MSTNATLKMRNGAFAVGLLAAAAGAPFAQDILASRGYAIPTLQSAQKLMALLDARSPGEREKGELTLTKNAAKPIRTIQPRERALGKIVQPKPVPTPEFVRAITSPALAVPALPITAPVTLADIVPPVTAPSPLSGGIGVPTIIASSNGLGNPPPGTTTNPPAPTPPPAVPEPGTWLTMVLGFGLTGWSIRRRSRGLRSNLQTA